MDKVVLGGVVKASLLKEALASCQMEGIGLDLTIEDLYLGELGIYKSQEKRQQVLDVFKKNAIDKLNGKESK